MNIVAIDIGRLNTAIAIWHGGELVHMAKFSISSTRDLVHYFDLHLKYFESVTCAFVEQQMVLNHTAVRIEAQIHLWFTIKCPHITCTSFSARKKYRLLPADMRTPAKRKKWAVQYASTLIPQNLRVLFDSFTKQDDVGDAIIIGTEALNAAKSALE